MAKRRAAEPLTFHAPPWKRLLLRDLPEEPPPPPLWSPRPGQPRGAPDPPPRKRKVDAGPMAEPAASPRKRRERGEPGGAGGAGEPERRGPDRAGPTPPPPPPPLLPERPRRGPGEEPRGARPPRGGGGRGDEDDGAGRREPPRGEGWGAPPRQVNEEFWQYNTFQYWRNPLPPIDLADIEAITEDNLAKAKLQDKNEEVEVDMES